MIQMSSFLDMSIHIKMSLIHRNPNEVICKVVAEASQALHVRTAMTSRGQQING